MIYFTSNYENSSREITILSTSKGAEDEVSHEKKKIMDVIEETRIEEIQEHCCGNYMHCISL